jgi:hypothetical protein
MVFSDPLARIFAGEAHSTYSRAKPNRFAGRVPRIGRHSARS